jgi:glyoxylase-like metal-dependent hydrolase (beta-lactamase superfamily II)
MKPIITLLLCVPMACLGQRGKNFVDSVEAVIDIKQNLIKIKDNYYLIQPQTTMPASNITLYVGSSFNVLVDNQWAKLGPSIESLVKTINNNPIQYIINTHYHFDHTNGNKYFGSKKVTIVAHKNLANRLAADQYISSTKGFNGKLFQRATPLHGLPSITFLDSLQIHDNQEIITIIHRKGAHTDGDAIVHFKNADIYCTGDIFITYGIPFIDEDNGGDIYETLKTIDLLISVSNSNTRIIPGHGPICTMTDLIAYKKLLTSYKDQVIDMMKKGLTLEKIKTEFKIDENIGGFRDELIPHIYRMALRHERFQ